MPNRYTLALLGVGLIGQAAKVALDVTTFGRVGALLGIGLAVAVGLTLFGFWAPRFHYGRALIQALPVGEVRAGDMPRTRVNAEDGELLCEEGRPLTKAKARRL